MAATLRSGYRQYIALDPALQNPVRHDIYKSIARTIFALQEADVDDLKDSNFALGVTFGAPGRGQRFSRYTTRLQLVKNNLDQANPLRHLQESIELEKQLAVDGIIAGFKQSQDMLAPDAMLLSVSAIFGLCAPIALGEDRGVLTVAHTPNGINGLFMICEGTEMISAQLYEQGLPMNINGSDYDITGDLAVLYDVLTTRDDELFVV